jgi:hypothetical protein
MDWVENVLDLGTFSRDDNVGRGCSDGVCVVGRGRCVKRARNGSLVPVDIRR